MSNNNSNDNTGTKYWGHIVLKYQENTSDAKKKQIRSEFKRALQSAGINGVEDDYFIGYVADNYVDALIKFKNIFRASPLLLDYLGGAWVYRIENTADVAKFLRSLYGGE